MAEITFISNKTRKELYKYFLVIIFAVITWILQLSIFSRLIFFDSSLNLMFLCCIYWGLSWGITHGCIFGIVCSFLSSSNLYDHTFYLSYPLIGILTGLLTKNIFSDEMLFFIILAFILTFPLELLNGWQYSISNPINIHEYYIFISLISAIINLCFSPFLYLFMKFLRNKLKIR